MRIISKTDSGSIIAEIDRDEMKFLYFDGFREDIIYIDTYKRDMITKALDASFTKMKEFMMTYKSTLQSIATAGTLLGILITENEIRKDKKS